MKSSTLAWLAVAFLWVTAVCNYVDRQSVYSLFPLIGGELGLSGVQLGLLASGFLWVYGFLSPTAGYFADRLGPRRAILASLAIWSAITWLTSIVVSYPQLLATRLLLGTSEALYLPAALSLIASLHPERTRARAIGLHQSGLYAGIVLGGWGGAWIGTHYGWRTTFGLLGWVGLLYAVPLALFLRRVSASPAEAVERRPESFADAAAIVMRSRSFLVVLAANGLISAAYWCVYTWLPLFLFERFHMTLDDAGFTATFYIQAASLAGVLSGGWLADWWVARCRNARLFTQSIGIVVAAPALFFAAVTGSRAVLVAAFVLFGLGRGFYDCNLMPVVCRLLPANVRATAYGFLNFVSCICGGLAALGGGVLKEGVGLNHALQISALLLLVSSIALALLAWRRESLPSDE